MATRTIVRSPSARRPNSRPHDHRRGPALRRFGRARRFPRPARRPRLRRPDLHVHRYRGGGDDHQHAADAFFFPVVAGVGLLGPVAAVGFYELARRRESGQEVHWFNFLDVRKRPTVDDMGMVAGLLL